MVIFLLQVPHKLIYYIHCSRKLERGCVVNIIKLPPVLPGELNLQAANLSLQSGEAILDWSQVEEAPENFVAVLLTDLDLVDHSEILGINTVPDSLSEVVLQVLTRQDNKAHHGSGHKRPANNNVVPVAWEPEEQADVNGIAPSVEAELPRTTQTLLEPPRSILQALSPSALRDEL